MKKVKFDVKQCCPFGWNLTFKREKKLSSNEISSLPYLMILKVNDDD